MRADLKAYKELFQHYLPALQVVDVTIEALNTPVLASMLEVMSGKHVDLPHREQTSEETRRQNMTAIYAFLKGEGVVSSVTIPELLKGDKATVLVFLSEVFYRFRFGGLRPAR